MCEAATGGALIAYMAVAAASTGYAAYTGYQEVQAQNEANAYNAKLAQNSAEIGEIQAKQIEEKGDADVQASQRRMRSILGSQKTGYAAAGVDVSAGGSVADIAEDTRYAGNLDALTIKRNAKLDAWSARAAAQQDSATAALLASQKRNPWSASTGALLSGGSQMGSTYLFASGNTGKKKTG